ncbi:MAG: DUF423 domain-containing protein [Proteobacteria bacterium]|nr:DUF423 domain-containing protein [Pseudomonadota bacterium]
MTASSSATGARWQAAALALLGASAVALGAFGAHALRGVLSAQSLQIWHTAVQYHFWHTLAFAVAAMMAGRCARIAAMLFAAGTVLFSGSLYALALDAPRWAGFITPVGGVMLILGWIALGVALIRRH